MSAGMRRPGKPAFVVLCPCAQALQGPPGANVSVVGTDRPKTTRSPRALGRTDAEDPAVLTPNRLPF